MKKNDWVIFSVLAVIALGFYLINGESIADRYGWEVIVVPVLAYIAFDQSRRIDALERKIKAMEYRPAINDPKFDGLGED